MNRLAWLTRRQTLALGAASLTALAGRVSAAPPPRLITTELVLSETALALGLPPLAAGNLPLYRRLVSEPELPQGISDLGPLNEPNMELIVHLAPDLILAATWQRGPQAALERIAPVLWLETIPFTQPPLEMATTLAQQIAGAGATSAAPLIAAFEAALARLTGEIARRAPPPLLAARFLEDGRHAMVFTEGSMPGDLLAKAGGRNALPAAGPPGMQMLGLSEILTLAAPILSLGPLPDSALFRQVAAQGALRMTTLPAIFPAGGLASATRFCQALATGIGQI